VPTETASNVVAQLAPQMGMSFEELVTAITEKGSINKEQQT